MGLDIHSKSFGNLFEHFVIKEIIHISLKGLFKFREHCPEAELLCACLANKASEKKEIKIMPWRELIRYVVSH